MYQLTKSNKLAWHHSNLKLNYTNCIKKMNLRVTQVLNQNSNRIYFLLMLTTSVFFQSHFFFLGTCLLRCHNNFRLQVLKKDCIKENTFYFEKSETISFRILCKIIKIFLSDLNFHFFLPFALTGRYIMLSMYLLYYVFREGIILKLH